LANTDHFENEKFLKKERKIRKSTKKEKKSWQLRNLGNEVDPTHHNDYSDCAKTRNYVHKVLSEENLIGTREAA
jgi:hypothetical protein